MNFYLGILRTFENQELCAQLWAKTLRSRLYLSTRQSRTWACGEDLPFTGHQRSCHVVTRGTYNIRQDGDTSPLHARRCAKPLCTASPPTALQRKQHANSIACYLGDFRQLNSLGFHFLILKMMIISALRGA